MVDGSHPRRLGGLEVAFVREVRQARVPADLALVGGVGPNVQLVGGSQLHVEHPRRKFAYLLLESTVVKEFDTKPLLRGCGGGHELLMRMGGAAVARGSRRLGQPRWFATRHKAQASAGLVAPLASSNLSPGPRLVIVPHRGVF